MGERESPLGITRSYPAAYDDPRRRRSGDALTASDSAMPAAAGNSTAAADNGGTAHVNPVAMIACGAIWGFMSSYHLLKGCKDERCRPPARGCAAAPADAPASMACWCVKEALRDGSRRQGA